MQRDRVAKRAPVSEIEQCNVRLPVEVIAWFDAAAIEEMRLHPGRRVTRSDLIREVLQRHVEEQQRPRRGRPRST